MQLDWICVMKDGIIYSYCLNSNPALNIDMFDGIATILSVLLKSDRHAEAHQIILSMMSIETNRSVIDTVNSCVEYESGQLNQDDKYV